MKKTLAASLAIFTALSFLLMPLAAEAKKGAPGALTVPVTTLQGVNGTFTIQEFVAGPSGVSALGTLVLDTPTGPRIAQVTVPVTNIATSAAPPSGPAIAQAVGCDILHLTLGPIHLDLLGLVVDLNQVQLDIVAVPGAGNLLGNLLCAIAGLLDQTPVPANLVQQIVNILNQILSILG